MRNLLIGIVVLGVVFYIGRVSMQVDPKSEAVASAPKETPPPTESRNPYLIPPSAQEESHTVLDPVMLELIQKHFHNEAAWEKQAPSQKETEKK